MRYNTFISVFTNSLIVDNIRSYLLISPKNSFELPNTYFFYNSSLQSLDYDEFFIYMAFFYNMEKSLYRFSKEYVLSTLKNRNIIDAAAENNELELIKRIYHFCNLSSDCYKYDSIFSSYKSLFSAIKHSNIELFSFIHSILNTRNSNYEEYLSYSTILNFAMANGELDIVKYICYKINPFSKNSSRCNMLKLELALEQAIKYDNLLCVFFLLDFYQIKTNSMSYPQLSLSVKEKIKMKAQIIHDNLFTNNNYTNELIDWWYIDYNIDKIHCPNLKIHIEYIKNKDYNINKIHCHSLKLHIEYIKNKEYLTEYEKACLIIMFLSKLLDLDNSEDEIYIIVDYDVGYLSNRKKIFTSIIRDIYYKPFTYYYKKDINLYRNMLIYIN